MAKTWLITDMNGSPARSYPSDFFVIQLDNHDRQRGLMEIFLVI